MIKSWFISAALAAAPVMASAQAASNSADPAVRFGARENVEFIALSPDGKRVVYAVPREGQGSRLYVLEVGTTQPKPITNVDGERQRLTGCNWVSNARLVCSLYNVGRAAGYLASASRMVALDADGTNIRVIEGTGSRLWGGDIIDWLPGRDNQILMQTIGSGGYIDVVQVDTTNDRKKPVDGVGNNGVGYLTDGEGRVRIMCTQRSRGATDKADSKYTFFYHPKGSDEWVRIGEYDQLTDEGPWPLAVDPKLNAAYIMEQDEHGRDIVYRMLLDGTERRDLKASHPEVDIDGLIRIGRRGRVVGVTYATERRQTSYFDPELQRVAQQLSRALPGQPLINFMGASDDEQKLLIWAGSDNDPGTYYLLDRATRQLTPIMRARPELDGMTLATVRPVTYRAADGTEVPAYLTLPPSGAQRGLPAIVMPHGGPSARDEWGFDWLAQYFAQRGYAVLQPNFRGSAGYGSDWFRTNGFQSWRVAIGDVNDAGRWLVKEGIADPSKLAILGWSYGGYAALQSAVTEPALFRAAVAIAPVTDLKEARDRWRHSWSGANVRDFFGTGPHLEEGSPARRAGEIGVPVLLFHGTEDLNVEIEQSRMMRDRLRSAGKSVELVEFPELDHQLQDSGVRSQVLRRSDDFLRQALKIQ